MKLYQINEDDLGELERILPEFATALMPQLNNRLRSQIRRVQAILSSVRWNYGPWTEVERIPADDDGPPAERQ